MMQVPSSSDSSNLEQLSTREKSFSSNGADVTHSRCNQISQKFLVWYNSLHLEHDKTPGSLDVELRRKKEVELKVNGFRFRSWVCSVYLIIVWRKDPPGWRCKCKCQRPSWLVGWVQYPFWCISSGFESVPEWSFSFHLPTEKLSKCRVTSNKGNLQKSWRILIRFQLSQPPCWRIFFHCSLGYGSPTQVLTSINTMNATLFGESILWYILTSQTVWMKGCRMIRWTRCG